VGGNPFAKPKMPNMAANEALTKPPEMPRSPDAGQQQGRLDDRRRALYAAGRAGTVLTSPLGAVGSARTTLTSLLGR
jgi:hypothetical protein